jgi:hypothetical protein
VLEATTTDPTIDGTTYDATFDLELEQDSSVAPVLAIGFQRTFGANWGFSAELGARITSLTLSASGQDALDPADRADFEEDLDEISDDLSDIPVLPFLSLGVSYRF